MRKLNYIVLAAVIAVMTPAIALAQGADAPTCLAAVAGADTGGFATTTLSNQSADDGAVSVINQVDITAVTGSRTITEDAVRYVNNCGADIELALVAQAPHGNWTAVQAQLFVSTIDAPTSLPTADIDGSWGDQPLTVTATTALGTASGSVIVPAGSSAQVAFVVDAGASFDDASLRWSAEARPVAS